MIQHQLEISDLTVSYRGVPAVHHVDVRIPCGSCTALIGPNGGGKTTLLKAIAGLLPYETGRVTFHGHTPQREASRFAYLPQREKVDWDFPITVRGLVEMGRYSHLGWWRPFGEEDRRKVDHALALMNLSEVAYRQINALSGGQQQRAFLARALAQDAHVFLLDEPFSGLDRTGQEALRVSLHTLAQAGHLVLAAYHDLGNMEAPFDYALLLNGELVAFGKPGDVMVPRLLEKAFATPVFSGKEAA